MKRPIGISVAACAALALAVAFTGCPLVGDLRAGTATVQGTPSQPTFAFDFVLVHFVLSVYEDGRWPKYWGIEKNFDGIGVNDASGHVREVQYAVVPKGFSAYMPAKHPTLGTNKLYSFKFEGAGVRGGGTFAIVDKAGAPSIVQFDSSRSFDDILKEFEKLVQKPSR